jgi:hypothetical protein
MTDTPAAKEICEHIWTWVSPEGTTNAARLCVTCHEPDPNWLNSIVEYRQVEEIDRNARTYGFEIGKGHPLTSKLDKLSDDNPFVNVNWRAKVDLEGK